MVYIRYLTMTPARFSATPRGWGAHGLPDLGNGTHAARRGLMARPAPRPAAFMAVYRYARIHITGHTLPRICAAYSTVHGLCNHAWLYCSVYYHKYPYARNIHGTKRLHPTQQNMLFVAFVHLLAFFPLGSLPPNCIFIRLGPVGLLLPSVYLMPSP